MFLAFANATVFPLGAIGVFMHLGVGEKAPNKTFLALAFTAPCPKRNIGRHPYLCIDLTAGS